MSGFLLCGDGGCSHTLVPDFFLDNYMPEANGEYVKIYLYLLRCLKSDVQELSIPLIADKFEHTESDVRRALKYWEKLNLLKLEYNDKDQLTGIRMLSMNPKPELKTRTDSAGKSAAAPIAVPQPQSKKEQKVSGRLPADLLSQQEVRQLLFICEQYLGKTLSSSEVARILDLHDSLGFSPELIEYLVEYCVSGEHKSLHYIEATARGWKENGIRTVSQAKEQTTTYNRAYFKILKAFGISSRNPVAVEISYMNKWLKDYGFSLELILEACSRTMAAIHQPGFEYADKILSSWKKNRITSLSGLEALDRERQTASETCGEKKTASSAHRAASQNRFHNFKERDYDFEKLQKQLINQ